MPGTGFQGKQNPEEIHRLVQSAIRCRRPIAAAYKGYRRLLCPHRIGWNREGDRRLLSYQYGGDSESGLGAAKDNWRCMALDKLSEVQVLEGSWHTAENHTRPATCMERVEIDVDDQPVLGDPRGPEHDLQNGQ